MARKEPSINIEGELSLNSDIDYMVVTSKKYMENEFLANISVFFNNLYPNITSSFIFIDQCHLDKTVKIISDHNSYDKVSTSV